MEAVKLAPVFLASDSWSFEGGLTAKYDKEKGIATVTGPTGGMWNRWNAKDTYFDKKGNVAVPQTSYNKDGEAFSTKFSMTGTNGVEVMEGGYGDDTLMGGKGRDVYTGGAGKDVFGIYGVKKNAKFITDFETGKDTLLLRADKKVFQRWQNQGGLFSIIAKKRQLTGKQDIIGYNRTNGKLFFYNGKTGVARLMAQLTPGTELNAGDIKLTIGGDNGQA